MSEKSASPESQESAEHEGTGPSDIHDPLMKREAKRAIVWLGIAALLALSVWLSQSLLILFGGVVFAAMIDGGARLLGRVLPIGRGWRIAIVLLLTVAFFVALFLYAGSQIAKEASAFPLLIEEQWQRALAWLNGMGLTIEAGSLQEMATNASGGLGQVTSAVGGLLGGLTTTVLIIVLAIYFAVEPRLYQRGISWMLPRHAREDFSETAEEMGRTLRRLLAGRLLGMLVEGVATWALLAIYGVPMAVLLGILTGLLAFLPNLGAIVSGLLMVLVGFSGGTDMGLYTLFVYVVVQFVDGYLIVPLIARKTVDLAPALVLGAQLILGVLFGILGLLLADPMVAMIKVWLEQRARNNETSESES